MNPNEDPADRHLRIDVPYHPVATAVSTVSMLCTTSRAAMPRLARLALTVSLLLAVAAVPVLAQDRLVNLRPAVGGAIFSQPDRLDTFLGSGVGGRLEVGVQVLPRLVPGLEVTIGGSYDRFTTNEGDLRLRLRTDARRNAEIDGGTLQVLSGTAGLRYTLRLSESATAPYVLTGMGVYHSILTPASIRDPNGDFYRTQDGERLYDEERDVQSNLGWHLGIGFTFQINATYRFFTEARYVVAYTKEDLEPNTFTIEPDTSTRYVPIRLGATIRLNELLW
jgi:hypothetical protein